MGILISDKVREKLKEKHRVDPSEVSECFANRDGKMLKDTREMHQTDPVTHWFISETHRGRKLKVVFIVVDTDIHIKTAYEPNEMELDIYRRKGEPK